MHALSPCATNRRAKASVRVRVTNRRAKASSLNTPPLDQIFTNTYQKSLNCDALQVCRALTLTLTLTEP